MSFTTLARRLTKVPHAIVGEPVSDAEVTAAESSLGVVFPAELRAYLSTLGHLAFGHFELWGLGNGLPVYRDLVRMTKSERTEVGTPIPHALVPVYNDGGGNLICVDTNDPSGRLLLWDHDGSPNQEPFEEAESLLAWINRLLDKDGET